MAIPYNKNEKYGCKEAYKHKAQSAETEDRWERARIKKNKQGNEPTIAEKKAEKANPGYDRAAADRAMFEQYGVQAGGRPSQDVTDALVNAILDEELAKANAEETGHTEQPQAEIPAAPVEPAYAPEEVAEESYDEEEAMAKKKKKKSGGKVVAIIAAVVVLLIAAAYGALFVMDNGTILDNISVAGVDVGGMTKEEAAAAVSAVADGYGKNDMTLHFVDEDVTLSAQETGIALDVDAAAEVSGYSKSNFCRVFREVVGESFHKHLNRYRINCATGLLRETSMQVSDIAVEVGLPETKSFCRVFREIMGMTPGEYRSMERRSECR